jgi:hypothetical protein
VLGHLSFTVADLERSIAFYDGALAPLGLTRVSTKPNTAGYGPPRRANILALKKQSFPARLPALAFTWLSMQQHMLRWTPSIPKRREPAEPIMVVLGFDPITGRPIAPLL